MDQEHDCLPPMENTGSWTLSGEGFKNLMEVIDGIIHSLDGLTLTMVHIGRKSRHHRKVVRWDERNRRRRLKGLPEKECPYPRIWKACIIERKEDGYEGDPDQHSAEMVREDHEAGKALGDAEDQTEEHASLPGVHLSD